MLKTYVFRGLAVLMLSIGFIAAPVSADVPTTPELFEIESLNDAVAEIDVNDIEVQTDQDSEAPGLRLFMSGEIACNMHLDALHKEKSVSQPNYIDPIDTPPDTVDWRTSA